MQLITIKKAAQILGVCERQIYHLEARDKDFPQRIQLSARCVRLDLDDLNQWISLRRGQILGASSDQSCQPNPAA